jgi:hypothetical protein
VLQLSQDWGAEMAEILVYPTVLKIDCRPSGYVHQFFIRFSPFII